MMPSREGQTGARQRQHANAPAGDGENGVAYGSVDRHRSKLARPAERRAALDEVHFAWRSRAQRQRLEAVEVELSDLARIERQRGAHARKAPHDSTENVAGFDTGV